MKKWSILSALVVFLMYYLGIRAKMDLFILLWMLLALCGFVFWVSDGMVIRSANPKNHSFLDINQSELDYAAETRKKASENDNPVTTIIISVAIAAAICLVHCYMMPI